MGGDKKLEEYYGKSVAEIKADFKGQVKDQLLVQQMQQKITSDLSITPREVKRFYDRIPEDSIPLIGAEVEYSDDPAPTEADRGRGTSRAAQDGGVPRSGLKAEKDFWHRGHPLLGRPGSASNCRELGLVPPGAMVPAFDAVAASLKEGEVSQAFKTEYGWHFMQMIERRGEQYNARHVLMRPQVAAADLQRARTFLDSIRRMVVNEDLTFNKAAGEFSDDEESRGMKSHG